MTEAEAISTLFEQFTTPAGFLQRLQHGEGLNRRGVEQVWQALDTLQQARAARTCIPREAVLALTFSDEALLAQYPDPSDELVDFYMKWDEKITGVLLSGLLPDECIIGKEEESAYSFLWFWEEWTEQTILRDQSLTEKEALAVLRQHLTGDDGLVVALRCRAGAYNNLGMAKAWFLLSQALETLGPIWAVSPCIPKDIALGLAEIRDLITNGWTLYDEYPAIQQKMLMLAHDLGAQVQRCLQIQSEGT